MGRLVLILAAVFGFFPSPAPAAPDVFIVGDMEKPTGNGAVADSPHFMREGVVTLHGAGNEVIAFQAVLRATGREEGLEARVSDLQGPGRIESQRHIQLAVAHYAQAADASYSWGPGAGAALPWRGESWPDALVPFYDPYDPARAAVGLPFTIPAERRNQSVWVDVWIPKGTPAGRYTGQIEFLQNGEPFKALPIELKVHPFDLPDEASIDGFGELYRETGVMFDSGVKFKEAPGRDWPIYRRYLQMAHAHRFLATHRAENGPLPRTATGAPADRLEARWDGDWDLYTPYVAPVLSGELFTEAEGYAGPRAGVGPSFFPAPFIEKFFGASSIKDHLDAHGGSMDPELIDTLRANAAAFWAEAQRNGWQDKRFFAYIFDEVDHADGLGEGEIVAFHRAMRQVQRALDEGTGNQRRIHLIWTSHARASRWSGGEADLADTISWWVPNGHALEPDYYRPLAARPGPTVWFYHSGQPAIGNHTINQLGLDLRTWGLLCRRYGVNGSFWWSMMSFRRRWDDKAFNPYEEPIHRDGETRWGNGVLFYPGSRLTMIGARRNIQGPVASMRMKAYRRGLQDVEYFVLAERSGRGEEAEALLKRLIPSGFAEGRGRIGSWSQQPEDYYAMRERLAELIRDRR